MSLLDKTLEITPGSGIRSVSDLGRFTGYCT
jgi:hypothetical protein